MDDPKRMKGMSYLFFTGTENETVRTNCAHQLGPKLCAVWPYILYPCRMLKKSPAPARVGTWLSAESRLRAPTH